MWVIGSILFLMIAIDIAFHGIAIKIILPIFERPLPIGDHEEGVYDDVIPLKIPSTQEIVLEGHLREPLHGKPLGLVINCAEFGADQWSGYERCSGLVERGYAVLSFSFSNFGNSDCRENYRPLHWTSQYELDDITAVINYAKSFSRTSTLPIVLFGLSRGGSTALMAACQHHDVKAVAVEGIFSIDEMMLEFTRRWASLYIPEWLITFVPSWHLLISLKIVRRLSQRRRNCEFLLLNKMLSQWKSTPVFLIRDGRDTCVPLTVFESTLKKLPSNVLRTHTIPHAKHNQGRTVDPELFDDMVVKFFNDALHQVPVPADRIAVNSISIQNSINAE